MIFSSLKYRRKTMDKILLIIKREYLTRVRKKAFIIMSILGPLLFGALFIIPVYIASSTSEERVIKVVDQSGYFQDKFENKKNLTFEYSNTSLTQALTDLSEDKEKLILHIPKINLENPTGILFYSYENIGIGLKTSVERMIAGEIEDIRLSKAGIRKSMLDSLKVDIDIATSDPETGEEETGTIAATGIGYVAAFAIYMFIFLYGAQVMRGVAEEKSSKVIEVIVSSVKPFQLMMGKILGIALVAITQLVIWGVLFFAISTGIGSYYQEELTQLNETPMQEEALETSTSKLEQAKKVENLFSNIEKIPIGKIAFSFVFFFFAGYLMYAALFATVGAAVDSMEDSQQFMLPITVPLIASIAVLGVVINEPHGDVAFWMSMIPLTSPVVMMMRVPFDVPTWQLALSMVLLVVGFIFTTWFAGRVYRVGILMHGSKVNYKTLMKWFFMKN